MSRFRFVKDDDGHLYLIPTELTKRFFFTQYDIDDEFVTFNNEFYEYCVGGSISNWTFENPKEEY